MALRPPIAVPTDLRDFTRWCKSASDPDVASLVAGYNAGDAAVTAAFLAADASHLATSDPHPQYTTAAELAAGIAAFLAAAHTWPLKQTFQSPVRLPAYTVGTLPAGQQGDTAIVTDATLPTFLGALVGGGAVVTTVFYNGSAWVAG